MFSLTLLLLNPMRSGLILMTVIFYTFTKGVFGAETEEVKAVRGRSVSLHTDVKEYQQILWMFGPQSNRTAQCRANETPACEITNKRFKNKLQIDNQTGSLTINNISHELEGDFTLQIFKNSHKLQKVKVFSVIITDPLPIPNISCDSSKCVVVCSVESVTNVTLSWYKGNSLVSSKEVSDLKHNISLDLKNHLDTNYSCVVNNSISNQRKQLKPADCCQGCSEAGYIALICLVLLLLLLLVIVAAVIYCCWKKKDGQDKMACCKLFQQRRGFVVFRKVCVTGGPGCAIHQPQRSQSPEY